jgi:hypothetical protein
LVVISPHTHVQLVGSGHQYAGKLPRLGRGDVVAEVHVDVDARRVCTVINGAVGQPYAAGAPLGDELAGAVKDGR